MSTEASSFVQALVENGLVRGILRLEAQVPFAAGPELLKVYRRRGELSEADRAVIGEAADALVEAFAAQMRKSSPDWGGLMRFERQSLRDFVLFLLSQQLKEARDDKFRDQRIGALLSPVEEE